MDSALILADMALSLDDQLAEAYRIRGWYFNDSGNPDLALMEYNKAIELNPNDWSSYRTKGSLYWGKDMVKAIENYQKAISLNHGLARLGLLKNLGYVYYESGINEKAAQYYLEAFKLDRDSATIIVLHSMLASWTSLNTPAKYMRWIRQRMTNYGG